MGAHCRCRRGGFHVYEIFPSGTLWTSTVAEIRGIGLSSGSSRSETMHQNGLEEKLSQSGDQQ